VHENAHIRQEGMIADNQWQELIQQGAVGDIMGRFLVSEGQAVDALANRCAVGLSLEDIAGKRLMAVAGGAEKADAILAALRTGVITDLVTDVAAAQALINKVQIAHLNEVCGKVRGN